MIWVLTCLGEVRRSKLSTACVAGLMMTPGIWRSTSLHRRVAFLYSSLLGSSRRRDLADRFERSSDVNIDMAMIAKVSVTQLKSRHKEEPHEAMHAYFGQIVSAYVGQSCLDADVWGAK